MSDIPDPIRAAWGCVATITLEELIADLKESLDKVGNVKVMRGNPEGYSPVIHVHEKEHDGKAFILLY